MKQSLGRKFALAAISIVGFAFLSAVLIASMQNVKPGGKDFIEYWAAEQSLVHHGNPYDAATIMRLEQAAGFDNSRPEFWYSPPLSMILALPMGFVTAKTGMSLWLVAQFAFLSLSILIVWILHGRPDSLLYLFGFLFAPAYICMQAGQISLFFLLGVVLFLYFHQSRPGLAGMALLPCVLKPHLFLPFAVVLLLWVISRKAYGILAGFCTALIAGFLVTLSFDRQAWSQYSQMMRTEGMLNEYVATLSVNLRFIIDRQAVGLQFVPCVAACIWAGWYFWTRRDRWNWMDEGLLVLLVSAMCRPYGWFFDESVLLPAVLTAMMRARQSGRPLWPIALVAGAALIEAFETVNVVSPYYLWTTPAWLACYLYATRKNVVPQKTAEKSPAMAAGPM